MAAHSLAEVYSALTRLPYQPRTSPEQARRLIHDNLLNHFEIVALIAAEYEALIDYLARESIAGAATYDALLLAAAEKEDPDQIVTFNERDFRRVYPALADRIVVP